jgi:hypothetical protein
VLLRGPGVARRLSRRRRGHARHVDVLVSNHDDAGWVTGRVLTSDRGFSLSRG